MTYSNSISATSQIFSSLTLSSVSESGNVSSMTKLDSGSSAATIHTQNDQSTVSTTANLLSQALSVSDERAGRVAALRETISSGAYSVSSADIADKLIQSMVP